MFFTELIPGTQHTRIAAYENYNGRFFGRLTIYWQETEKIVNGFHYLRGALFLLEINNVTHSCLTLSHRNPGRTLYDKVKCQSIWGLHWRPSFT